MSAYVVRMSDWSSDVCSSELGGEMTGQAPPFERIRIIEHLDEHGCERRLLGTTRGMFDQLPAKGVGLIRGFHASSYVRRQSGRQAYPAWHAACACHAPRAGRTLPPELRVG